MIQIVPEQSSSALRALFGSFDLPAGVRCRGVLEGYSPGTIYTDDAARPTWAVLSENSFGTLYPVGAVDKNILTALVAEWRQKGDTLIGLWPGDPLRAALPDAPQYEGMVIDYTDRPVGQGLDALLSAVPAGCEIRPMDAELHSQSPWYEDRIKAHGSIGTLLEKEIGFALVRDGALLSEATAGPVAAGMMEMGTITLEPCRGRGYATVVCAHTIRECEARGLQTYWNCNRDNQPSVALGRKLGYRSAREYLLFGWFLPD
jgi:GNAT superfamily N-acetyltransferase